MKKLLVLLVAIITTGQAFGSDAILSVGGVLGVQVPYTMQSYDATILAQDFSSQTSTNTALLSLGAFVDLTYFVVGAQYAFQIGNLNQFTQVTKPISTTVTQDTATGAGNLELIGILKYPIKIFENFIFFPMIGVEYDLNVTYKDKESMSSGMAWDLSDVYLLVGGGIDLYIDTKIYLRPLVQVGLNLTASPSTPAADTKYFGIKSEVGIAIGFDI